jgi:hypothetical protein
MSDPIPLKVELGIDVVSLEARAPAGTVRQAVNIELNDKSGFRRRDGYVLARETPSTAMWHAQNMDLSLYVADNGDVHRFLDDGSDPVIASGATEFWPIEHAHWVYVGIGSSVIRIDPDFSVRTAGIANLIGMSPTLTGLDNGGLPPGIYQVAVSYLNDLGEESGLSASSTITLTDGVGTIQVDLPPVPDGGVSMSIYRSMPNGEQLYRVATVAADTSYEISISAIGMPEQNWMRAPLPSGMLASYNGLLYSARGSFLYYTDDFNPNLSRVRDGFIPFGEPINVLAAVDNGLFVGTPSRVYFLGGGNPEDFTLKPVAQNGTIFGSGVQLPGYLFQESLLRGAVRLPGGAEAQPVAVWLSTLGIQVGLFGGSVLTPQEERISLDCDRAYTSGFKHRGIHQLLCATKGLNLGVGGAPVS